MAPMKYALAVLLALCASATAQLPAPALNTQAVNGKFYISVDDKAHVLLNGTEVLSNEKLGHFSSNEVSLKPGDRLVIQLKNVRAERYFAIAFESTDKRTVISFPRTALKILPTLDATDFTPADFAKLTKYAKAENRKRDNTIPFKHTSDYLWGDFDECALGCILTSQMFITTRP